MLGYPSDAVRAQEMLRYYPKEAWKRGIEGHATIACLVTALGKLKGCRVESEDPPGLGFGDAALKMSVLFKMRPATENGTSVEGGTVRVPITFKLPEDPPTDWSTQPVPVLTSAAESGDGAAEYQLGQRYSDGAGVPKDASKSFCWIHRAAEHGYPLAWMSAGMRYGMGDGVAKDTIEAYKWFHLVTLLTAPGWSKEVKTWAAEDEAKMALLMTPEEVAEAKQRADTWWATVKGRGPLARGQQYVPFPGDKPVC
jgi:TonB family protein